MIDFFNVMFGVVQMILLVYICIVEVKNKSSVALLWATLVLMFGFMHFYSVMSGKSNYDETVLLEASVFVIMFSIFYLVTRMLTIRYVRVGRVLFKHNQIIQTGEKNTGMIFLVFAVVSILMVKDLVIYSGGILNTSWGAVRGLIAEIGYVNSNQVYMLLYFVLSGLLLYFLVFKKRRMSILCSIIICFVTIITRNRIMIIPLLVAVIAYFIFKIEKRISFRYYLLALASAIIVIYLVYGLRVFRHYGSISSFIQNFNLADFLDRINTYIVTGNGELGLRNSFYHFISQDNEFSGFGTGTTYIRMIMVYIPTRFSLGIKPSDFAITMGTAMGNAEGVSTHPTLFGDCFANLGWAGVLLGVFWALYATLGDRIILKFNNNLFRLLAYTLFATTYVIIGRGSVYNSIFYVAWGTPILFLMSYFYRYMPKINIVIRKKK